MSAGGRRATIGALVGLAVGLVIGVVIGATTDNLGLAFSVGGALALLLGGSGSAVGRSTSPGPASRRQTPRDDGRGAASGDGGSPAVFGGSWPDSRSDGPHGDGGGWGGGWGGGDGGGGSGGGDGGGGGGGGGD
jgi:hypothetical protein